MSKGTSKDQNDAIGSEPPAGLDMNYPAQEANLRQSHSYFFTDFFDRIRRAYERDSPVSERMKTEVGHRRDKKGLIWTHKEQLWIPDDQRLRDKCIEAVHAHPYAGHYGVECTLKKA
jgi:hypothetical protein